MAHFAELNQDSMVVNIIVVDNEQLGNTPFPESENLGVAYLNSFLPPAVWKQTSYNNAFRVRYAGIGYSYMPEYDAFVPPKLYTYFVFDETNLDWIPPVPRPEDGFTYFWDDTSYSWKRMKESAMNITVLGV